MSYRVQWETGEKENAPIVELVRITRQRAPVFHRTRTREESIKRGGCWLETGLSLTTTAGAPAALQQMQSQHLCYLLHGRTGCLEASTVLLLRPNRNHGWIYALGRKTVLQEKKKNSLNFCNFFLICLIVLYSIILVPMYVYTPNACSSQKPEGLGWCV